MEEEKLKAKYPQAMGGFGRPGGHSAFLQKRLQKGQKYFDSGDYQMAKQKTGGGMAKQIFANKVTTGEGLLISFFLHTFLTLIYFQLFPLQTQFPFGKRRLFSLATSSRRPVNSSSQSLAVSYKRDTPCILKSQQNKN